MAKYIYCLFIILCLYSCNADHNLDTPAFALSKDTTNIWISQNDTIQILNSNKEGLSCYSKDNGIAEPTIENNQLIIKAKFPGSTFIFVCDKMGKKRHLLVNSMSINGSWFESMSLSQSLYYEVKVITNDFDLSNKIRTTLLDSLMLNHLTSYTFRSDNTLQVYNKKNGNANEGSYLFICKDKNATVLLNYGINKRKYYVEPYNSNIIRLTEDLTNQERLKYPNNDIIEIKAVKYFIRARFNK